MAQNKKSFILYADQKGVFDQLPDELAGKLIKHIFAYVNDENPISDNLIINIAFEPIKQSLKRDLRRWEDYIEKQSVNGKKGGRPPKAKESQETQAFFQKPKKADSVSVSDNDNVKEYKESLNLWLQYKKEKKQTYKPTGLEALKKTIVKDYPNPLDFTKAVEYSIANNYSGIYPPKKITLQTPTITHKRATLDD
jgi:hypothetical protein